jgi:NADPH:quinone reductase-like Zn-dependent oxidoreductase
MKIIQLRQPATLDSLHYVDGKEPGNPEPGQLLVEVHASSLNYHDYAVVTGKLKAADGRIPLSDAAGTVRAVGEGVTEFAVGDQVVSTFFPTWLAGGPFISDFSTSPGDGIDGYACKFVVRPATSFTLAPKNYNPAQSATLTVAGLTAWRALVVNGGLKAGDKVLVLGTGGVSIFALQFAKAMGAEVIATSSSDEKLERVRALGASHTINYKTHPEWGAQVLACTGGRGVDHVIEVGGAGTLPQSINACRVGGHIALIGVLSGRAGPVPTAQLMSKQIRLQGLVAGNRQHQQDMVAGIEAMGVKPIIDSTFELKDLASAFRHEESGKHFGKISIAI